MFSQLSVASAETFKLPQGTTYRAQADGVDCGVFGPEDQYVVLPHDYQIRGINFTQLSADKDLNQFLVELSFTAKDQSQCIYGAFFERNRETKRLELIYSELEATGSKIVCSTTSEWLDQQLFNVPYEASRRGFRYVAITIVEDTPNDVCTSGNVRFVFDRR